MEEIELCDELGNGDIIALRRLEMKDEVEILVRVGGEVTSFEFTGLVSTFLSHACTRIANT